ncbi:MAG: hypothetical protein U0X39_00550 [Bacteroidales bacterium]
MKKILLISASILILVSACSKDESRDYTLKLYGDAFEDIGYSISIASDGYVIAGQLYNITRQDGKIVDSLSSRDLGVLKTDWNGNIVWKTSTGGRLDDWGKKIYKLDDGSLVCVGTTTVKTSLGTKTRILVVRLSAGGDIMWEKSYGGRENNWTGTDIVQVNNGFIVLGTIDSAKVAGNSAGNIAGKTNLFFLKIHDNGDYWDSNDYGFMNNDAGVAIKKDIDGGFIILGSTEESNPGMQYRNLLLVRINQDLSITDDIILGDALDEYAADMEVLDDGSLMVAGNIGNETVNQKIFIRKINKDFHSTQPAYTPFEISGASSSVNAMTSYGNNSFILSGQTGGSTAGDILVFEADANGTPVQGTIRINGSSGVQASYDVVAGDDGYVIAVGKSSYDANSMITFFKFRI